MGLKSVKALFGVAPFNNIIDETKGYSYYHGVAQGSPFELQSEFLNGTGGRIVFNKTLSHILYKRASKYLH